MIPVITNLPLRRSPFRARRAIRIGNRLFTLCCYTIAAFALAMGGLALYTLTWAACEAWRALQ